MALPGIDKDRANRMQCDTPLKEALVALTDALAKRPAEEILFQSANSLT
jgi:hypothetical protein